MAKEIKPVFQGELMLAGWQESHTAGAKVTFWLPDSESLEVFKGMTAKKGNVAGQRFMAVLVEIGEDEQPIEPEHPKPKGGELARLAGMWCNDQEFYAWIRPVYDRMLGGSGNGHGDMEIGLTVTDWKEFCRHAVLVFCDIDSRAELDNNEQAAEKFHRLIRIPYSQWLQDNKNG